MFFCLRFWTKREMYWFYYIMLCLYLILYFFPDYFFFPDIIYESKTLLKLPCRIFSSIIRPTRDHYRFAQVSQLLVCRLVRCTRNQTPRGPEYSWCIEEVILFSSFSINVNDWQFLHIRFVKERKNNKTKSMLCYLLRDVFNMFS